MRTWAIYHSGSLISCGDLTALDDQTVDELVQLYNQVMTALLDRHCPTVTVRCRVNKKTTPWFDADCRAARRRARAAEKRFIAHVH